MKALKLNFQKSFVRKRYDRNEVGERWLNQAFNVPKLSNAVGWLHELLLVQLIFYASQISS